MKIFKFLCTVHSKLFSMWPLLLPGGCLGYPIIFSINKNVVSQVTPSNLYATINGVAAYSLWTISACTIQYLCINVTLLITLSLHFYNPTWGFISETALYVLHLNAILRLICMGTSQGNSQRRALFSCCVLLHIYNEFYDRKSN